VPFKELQETQPAGSLAAAWACVIFVPIHRYSHRWADILAVWLIFDPVWLILALVWCSFSLFCSFVGEVKSVRENIAINCCNFHRSHATIHEKPDRPWKWPCCAHQRILRNQGTYQEFNAILKITNLFD